MRLMPTLCSLLRRGMLLLTAVWLGLVFAACAAQSPAAPPQPAGKAPASANAAPAELEIPKSVFTNPSTPQQGRDPFFPQSARMPKPVMVATTNTLLIVAELELKGISGSAEHRLAIINNRTFEPGEEGEVLSSQGRVRIICREIKADSVVVQVGSELRVLRLRPRP